MKKTALKLCLAILMFAGCQQLNDIDKNLDNGSKSAKRSGIPDVVVTHKISSSGENFDGSMTITNNSDSVVEDWFLEFEWDWEITSKWSCEVIRLTGNRYKITPHNWNNNIPANSNRQFGFSGKVGTAGSTPQNCNVKRKTLSLPEGPSSELEIVHGLIRESDTTFKYQMVLGNTNTEYRWNSSCFAVDRVEFTTTSEVKTVKHPKGEITFKQEGDLVTLDLREKSIFLLDTFLKVNIEGDKKGDQPLPGNFKVIYQRGQDIIYPEKNPLPASWSKGMPVVAEDDLIADSESYYQSVSKPVKDTLIMYNEPHPTQLWIGQVRDLGLKKVSNVPHVRMRIPGINMAMGLGIVYEFLSINPNYMAALGTKENYAAGFAPLTESDFNKTDIDGEIWAWPMHPHVAGPYQQEDENFDDCRDTIIDWFPVDAKHDNYVPIKVDPTDPHWITSTFSSAISITRSREQLNALTSTYNQFIQNAADPNAEFAMVTFTYNRGCSNFLKRKVLGEKRAEALASTDIMNAFDMTGHESHVPTVLFITEKMNNDTSDIYDEEVSWADMELFFGQIRKFYGRGVPTDSEWESMKDDVKNAFDILKQHWGGETVSFRYDFLTLLRVMKAHLPSPVPPRPTGNNWYNFIKNSRKEFNLE